MFCEMFKIKKKNNTQKKKRNFRVHKGLNCFHNLNIQQTLWGKRGNFMREGQCEENHQTLFI